MRNYKRYDVAEVRTAILNTGSLRQALKLLGKPPVGGNSMHLAKFCDKNDIDRSHHLGQAHNRGTTSNRKLDPRSRLVTREPNSGRQKAGYLREGMLASGVDFVCSQCNNPGEWMGKQLTLEVDHIDRCHWNDLLTNLRFVCPNCHQQM